MNLITITEVSKNFNISTRTLRYYEQIGLLQSVKKDDYAYRTYDEAAVLRLQQIVVLRKLRIPLKQIITILENENTAEIIETFRQNMNDVDDEITALSTIKSILNTFIMRLNENTHLDIKVNLLDDISILDVVDSLTVTKIAFKEEKTMDDLNKASGNLNKLADRDVRIVYLPSATVASAHIIGGNAPEFETDEILEKFIYENNLLQVKPDLRHYGFNNPDGSNNGAPASDHGYERWVTIPDDMDVSAPLTKKYFSGGLYAAHSIMLGEWDRWSLLWVWIENNNRFNFNFDKTAGMDGMMEEHVNTHYYFKWRKAPEASKDPSVILQIDLLIPIKEKEMM